MTLETSIERNGEEIQIYVEYSLSEPIKGKRDSLGVPMEPDESPDIEIGNVINLQTNKNIDLSPLEEEEILDKLWRNVEVE